MLGEELTLIDAAASGGAVAEIPFPKKNTATLEAKLLSGVADATFIIHLIERRSSFRGMAYLAWIGHPEAQESIVPALNGRSCQL